MARSSRPRGNRGPRNRMDRPRPLLAVTLDGIDAAEAARVAERVCGSKQRYEDPGSAWGAVRAVRRRTGGDLRAYRCPFSGGTRAAAHWHIGHVPSIGSLRRVAAAIRIRAQRIGMTECGDEVHTQPVITDVTRRKTVATVRRTYHGMCCGQHLPTRAERSVAEAATGPEEGTAMPDGHGVLVGRVPTPEARFGATRRRRPRRGSDW